MPRDITVRSGDTVVWGSTGFHSVTFNPVPPNPPDNYLETAGDGTQVIVNNPQTRDPVKPSAVYDPTQWFNSGNLAVGQPNGTAWTLTFEVPGTFEYYCSVHQELGMKGTVTVVPRT
jgi:plastocyanin